MSDPYSLYYLACERIADRLREAEHDQLIAASRSLPARQDPVRVRAHDVRRRPDA